MRTKVFAFLDTNILLQYREFTQIDWPSVLNGKRVCLVFSQTVVRELDKHKYDPKSQRRQSRARSVLKKLRSILGVAADGEKDIPMRPNVTLRLYIDPPRLEEIPGLSIDSNDDLIMRDVIEFQAANPELEEGQVIFIADDTVALYKARALGIRTHELGEEYLLEPEPGDTIRKIRELEKRLDAQSSQRPKLGVGFLGSGDAREVHLDQVDRNATLKELLDEEPTELYELVSQVRAAYDSSPKSRPVRDMSGPFNVPNYLRGHRLDISHEQVNRIWEYLSRIGIDCRPSWLRPKDAYTHSVPLPFQAPDPKGPDAHWYSLVVELDEACGRDARRRFDATSECTHHQLTVRLQNTGVEGARDLSVSIASKHASLSSMLPQFYRPLSPREKAPPAFASLASDERPASYELTNGLRYHLEVLRPQESVEIDMGYLLSPGAAGTVSLKLVVRASNLADPITRECDVIFNEGVAEYEREAASWRTIYGRV